MNDRSDDRLRKLSLKLDELESAVKRSLHAESWTQPSARASDAESRPPMGSTADSREVGDSFMSSLLARLFGTRRQ